MYLVIIGIADFENLCDVLVAAKGHLYWKKLGKYLGLRDSTLNDIGSQHSKPEECLLYCLSRWLRRYDDVDDKGGPTHSSLKKALKLINKEEIAERISETFNDVGASKGQLVMVFNKHIPTYTLFTLHFQTVLSQFLKCLCSFSYKRKH